MPTPSVEATSTGLGVAVHVERELAPEPADARHHGAQALDRGVTGGNVHTGAGIGGAALSHGGQTPGSAPWWTMAVTGAVRPRLTGARAARATGVG